MNSINIRSADGQLQTMPEQCSSPGLPGGIGRFQSFREKQAPARAFRHRLDQLVVAALLLLAALACDVAAAGHRTAETLNGSQSISQWSYGSLSRLRSEAGQAAPPSSALVIGSLTSVDDRVGNRTDRTGMLGAATAQTQQLDQRDPLDNDNAPATFTSGSEVNGNTPHVAGKTYEYDPENRLVRVNGGQVEMVYDGDGHRVLKTSPAGGGGSKTTYYLVDDLNPTGYAQVLEEWEATGTEPPRLVRSYTHGLSLISARDSSESYPEPTTHYYGYDGHGSARFLTGETGPAVTDTYTYDAFGVLLDQTPVDVTARSPNSYLYAGEQWDSDLGFYYNRARYLDPNLGRFWTMDTFEGNQYDPLSLHKYLYAQADPVNGRDPSGHESLVSLNFSIAIFSQLTTHELRGGNAALRGARELFGADEGVNLSIYAIDVATIIDEKIGELAFGVSGVLGGVRLVGLAEDFLASQGPLRFSQASAFWEFHPKGDYAGKTIGQLADLIRRGVVKPSEVKIEFITHVVDGRKVRLIVNTRSSLALKRAGVPETSWYLIDTTTQNKDKVLRRLRKNNVPEDGTDVLRIGEREGIEDYSIID